MTEEAGMRDIEERLRAAGSPPSPPAGYADMARAAALGPAPAADVVRFPVRRTTSLMRALLAAAVIAVSAAGALLIGVGGHDGVRVTHTVALAGDSGARASLDIGEEDGPLRDVVLHVSGLDPAPDGRYYEMWMSDGNDSMALMAFNTCHDGTVDVRAQMPSGIGWDDCWITIEGRAGTHTTVLRAT
jgi:hypothetical protein